MKTLTIEIPDEPNALTVKTLADAHSGKGIDQPIENVRAFIDSL